MRQRKGNFHELVSTYLNIVHCCSWASRNWRLLHCVEKGLNNPKLTIAWAPWKCIFWFLKVPGNLRIFLLLKPVLTLTCVRACTVVFFLYVEGKQSGSSSLSSCSLAAAKKKSTFTVQEISKGGITEITSMSLLYSLSSSKTNNSVYFMLAMNRCASPRILKHCALRNVR